MLLEAIRKKLPDVFARPDLEMIALDYFRRLGHDNHRRLSKLHEWEEKKSKASWGAETVDYEKIAVTAVQAMKAADVNRRSRKRRKRARQMKGCRRMASNSNGTRAQSADT